MHFDSNGTELQVGDFVSYGDAIGKVLILEDWLTLGTGVVRRHGRAGVYVSKIGYWGDCLAIAARRVTKVEVEGCDCGPGDCGHNIVTP